MADPCRTEDNVSSDSSLSSPPPKRTKSSARHHKCSKGKEGDRAESRKRKVHNSTESTSSDSDDEHDKKRIHRHPKNLSLEVFQECFGGLVEITQSFPEAIAAQLFSKKLISHAVLEELLTSQGCSGIHKASKILLSVGSILKVSPEKLKDFVKVIEQESAYDAVTSQIKSMPNHKNSVFICHCYSIKMQVKSLGYQKHRQSLQK